MSTAVHTQTIEAATGHADAKRPASPPNNEPPRNIHDHGEFIDHPNPALQYIPSAPIMRGRKRKITLPESMGDGTEGQAPPAQQGAQHPQMAHPQMGHVPQMQYPYPPPSADFSASGLPHMPPPLDPNQMSPPPDGSGGPRSVTNRQLSTSKRAEQNRKAQRAFRERRDQHVKALESRSQLLDAALASADEANRRWEECRALVDQLRIENAALRSHLQQSQAQLSAGKHLSLDDAAKLEPPKPESRHPSMGPGDKE